jgi:hypothetical protein
LKLPGDSLPMRILFGEQAMAGGIRGGAGFAFRGDGAGGAAGVGAIGAETFLGEFHDGVRGGVPPSGSG